ncbi:sigma-70 family RNA polymerase sigma factor [Gammaproteobacteria bacterium]|nr:sigma-70 family RNA polymerase sigma factor [Gammaproteobacteria bacterium]
MEAIAKADTNTVIKQTNSIVLKHSSNKVCKNRIEMPFKELITHLSKKLMAYAMTLTSKNEDDALDLIQSTIVDLMNNKEKLMDSDQPMAYAKKILKNNFIDNYRKKKRMPLVSIDANDIPVKNEGFQEDAVVYQEMLNCLEDFDETDRTILAMLGAGNSYEEIQEVISDISMVNLRVKANRARIRLANCMGEKL